MKGIYKLYYRDKIVYIGKSLSNMRGRVKHHVNVNKLFDKAVLYEISNNSDIAILETYLISKEKPRYNTEYNYSDDPTIEFDSEYLVNGIDISEEVAQYKESIKLTKGMEIIDLSIKEMFVAGISFEEIIQTINSITDIE